jgi:hypothetical protein
MAVDVGFSRKSRSVGTKVQASVRATMMAICAKFYDPRVSTAGLHRPNPVAREMPGFIGFFARRGQVAEREGFPTNDRGHSKNTVKRGILEKAGEGLRPPVCTTYLARKAVFFDQFRAV